MKSANGTIFIRNIHFVMALNVVMNSASLKFLTLLATGRNIVISAFGNKNSNCAVGMAAL